MARLYLIISDRGIETRPIRADDVAAALANHPGTRAAAIELLTTADVADDGSLPPAFLADAANRETLAARAQAALTANGAFLAKPTPTNAETLAQVKTLTKECSALIRLALGLLDTTAGT